MTAERPRLLAWGLAGCGVGGFTQLGGPLVGALGLEQGVTEGHEVVAQHPVAVRGEQEGGNQSRQPRTRARQGRRLAEQPTIDEVLARIAGRRGGRVGFDQAVTDLSVDRGSR